MTHNERNLVAWLIVVIVLALIAGCATPLPVAPKVLTEVKVVEVQVPVRVACFKADEIPPKPVRLLRIEASEKSLTAGAVAELRAWETYFDKANALLQSCVKEVK